MTKATTTTTTRIKSFQILLAIVTVVVVVVVGIIAIVTYINFIEEPKFAANVDNFTISDGSNEFGNDISIESDNILPYEGTTTTPSTMPSNIGNKLNVDNDNRNSNSNTAIDSVDFDPNTVATRKLRRGKRYLDFVKGTRISWRTTVKNNILKVNTLWGYGFGFRSNFPFPDKADRLRPFFKRDLLHATVDMLDGHGLDGQACILKSYCMALLDDESHISGGMIFKLLKMLFRTGFDGEACMLKAFCTAHLIDGENEMDLGRHGMLFKLLKYIFTLDTHDKRHFPYLHLDNCQQILHSHCPLSFNSISPYTDDV